MNLKSTAPSIAHSIMACAAACVVTFGHAQAQAPTATMPSQQAPATTTSAVDLQTVTDAYAYLLGRAVVVRQERTDLMEPGIGYNVIKYNRVGAADFVNPNLDVAYMEAWIAVDDKTAVLLEVPEVIGRYYTAQILDEWGEVITNINERNYPSHPHGTFAFVAPGSTVKIPDGAVRIELHSRKAKMLARVELKDDRDGAVTLQKRFLMKTQGTPAILPAPPMASFDNEALLGAELFDDVDALIDSAPDVSPVAPQLQAKAREVARLAKDAQHRKSLNLMIKEQIVPKFQQYAATQSGVTKNQWVATIGTGNYGADYWRRSAANLLGLWANTNDEVVYFFTTQDGDGQALNGTNDYILEFSAAGRPDTVVNAYWSVILVDVPNYRVVPNSMNRFNFNNYSGLNTGADGSLKILFARAPRSEVPESNWLPAPDGKAFFLNMRTYVPRDVVKRGEWFPPKIQRLR